MKYIYSKYPISETTIIETTNPPSRINYCSLLINNSLVDVVGVHLSSNNYNEHVEYMTPDHVGDHHDIKKYLGNILMLANMERSSPDCRYNTIIKHPDYHHGRLQ